jgi:asparagine synthase
MWGVTRELHRRTSARGARVLLTGTWGDQVLFSCGYLVDLFRRLAWGKIWRHLREYPRWLGKVHAQVLTRRFAFDLVREHLPRPFLPPLKRVRRRLTSPELQKPWFSDAFLRQALQFADRPAEIGGDFHSVQAKSIYFEARSKHHVHCLEWNNKTAASRSINVALPFLDRDLLAFLMAIPGEMQNWKGVPRALLREALLGALPEPVRRRNWKADFSEIVNTGVAQDASIVSQALSANSLGVRLGYLDAERLAPEVGRLSAGLTGPDCVASWNLADLFGLEVWLQVFFGEQAAATILSDGRSRQISDGFQETNASA